MSIAEALQSVGGRIQALSQQLSLKSLPRLVAVSKTKPVELLREAYDAGQRHFGENYVQELVEKAPMMPADVRWHMIGHLQSNKAKVVASIPNLYMVESVDSVKLADMLNKHVPEDRAERLRVLVQVNTSGEESKSGVDPSGCLDLVKHVLSNCTNLQFMGLMTIGRLGDISPECFETLVKCRDEVLEANIPSAPPKDHFELSMGMSGDFELAIQHGSTNVRVGSTIFGERDYSAKQKPEPVGDSTVSPTETTSAKST